MNDEEICELLHTEFYRGARALLSYLRKNVTNCTDNNNCCTICNCAKEFLGDK